MRTKLLLLALLLACAPIAQSTDLRGRIDGQNPYSRTMGPLAGVPIGLFWINPDGSYTLVRQASTGPDGMYYLRGVYAGNYVLQVGGVNYPLGVGNGPYQDIPVIVR
jgi:hypothetical protein